MTWAELQLRRVPGTSLEVENIRFGSLAEFFSLSQASALTHEYTVAWIYCLARGRSLGRGHLTRADHAAQRAEERATAPRRRLAVPATPPISMVNRLTLRPFNALYYWRQPSRRKRSVAHLLPFFHPLDSISHWNRMYGPAGFLQYQCVLPPATAADGVAALLQDIARSGQGSFLAVLKQFGDTPSRGMLSFPRPGTTLALDFPGGGPAVFQLLDRLDRIVDAAGGALYPAKDARMSAHAFQHAYPHWQAFSRFIDSRFSSGFWRRVTE